MWQTIKPWTERKFHKISATPSIQHVTNHMQDFFSYFFRYYLKYLWNELFGENLISCTFTYKCCLSRVFHWLSLVLCFSELQRLWWQRSHLRKWQHQFSLHPLPGTLLYTVLLRGNDACIGSVAWIGMFVLICHDWDDRIVCHPHVWEICPPLERAW